jgi:hypothetical protein
MFSLNIKRHEPADPDDNVSKKTPCMRICLHGYPLKGRVCKGGLFAIQYSPIPVNHLGNGSCILSGLQFDGQLHLVE